LLSWLQGELQYYLPHQRLIVASGDFASHRIDLEVIPALPGAPSRPADPRPLSTFLQTLLHRWIEGKRLPLTLDILESGVPDSRSPADAPDSAARILHGGRCLLIHGITDRRSNRDSLYVMLGSKRYSRPALNAMQVLLPYLDTTLRRVASPVPSHVHDSTSGEWGLSRREQEIMKWVRLGKTNLEIASILGISAFTVKNHMRRIFKTLGVASRVQAAMKMAPPEERGE
jgi:transcriptional regulator EpsA